MNIAQLLDKFVVLPDIEIVIAFLPEVLGLADEPAGDSLLEGLNRNGERIAMGLAKQQVDVLGHDDVSEDS